MKVYILLIQWLLNRNIAVADYLMYFYDKFAWKTKENLNQAIFGLKPNVLKKLASKKLLWVFREAYQKTPALKYFYRKLNFDPKKVKTIVDFINEVPETNKENYIYTYTLEDRCRDGRLPKNGIIFKSAGVAGERTYWTQSLQEEDRFTVFVPFGLEYLFGYSKKNYHLINCWAFGTWPTAIDFTKAARECGRMINIGPNIDETLETIKKLGNKHNYLISGYPPYLRNLIYQGEQKGIRWSDYNIDVITGGEGFVEEWRDLLKKKIGRKALIYSAYGSTDKGLGEGIETPLSVAIRNLIRVFQLSIRSQELANNLARDVFRTELQLPKKIQVIELFENLFHKNVNDDVRIPMFFQTDPLTYFQQEVINNSQGINRYEVITTNLKTYASQPVIKYNIQDESGIIEFETLFRHFKKIGINPKYFENKIANNEIKSLPYPFFYVFGRSSGMISIDGANIFPEEIGRAIENFNKSELINSFIIRITDDYRFGLDLEMKQKLEPNEIRKYDDEIIQKIAEFSPGFNTIKKERLQSAKVIISYYKFGEGPFLKSPSVNPHSVKYQYVGPKVFGHH